MRPPIDLRTLTGTLAVAASLALLSPGIDVVRAELEQDAAAVDAPACSAAEPAVDLADFRQMLAEAQIQVATEPPADGEAVVLNNRGYNYGPPPIPDPTRVLEEARRSQAR